MKGSIRRIGKVSLKQEINHPQPKPEQEYINVNSPIMNP
jgi:hypothetical protein